MIHKKKWLNRGIRFTGLGILIFILFKIDYARLLQCLTNLRLSYLFIALACALVINFIKGLRLYYILKVFHFHYDLRRCIASTFIGNYLGAITPGRIGELAQAYYLSREADIPLASSIPLLIYSRIFDLYLVGMVFIIGLLNFEFIYLDQGTKLILYFLFGLVSALIFIPAIFTRFLNFIQTRRNPLRFPGGSIAMVDTLKLRNIFIILILTGGIYVFLFGRYQILAEGLDISINVFRLIFYMAIINILAYLPITVAGLGTTQVALVYLLGRDGISTEASLLFSFIIFFTIYVWGIILGALFWWHNPIRIREILAPPE